MKENSSNFTGSYSFSQEEILSLAKFFRKNENDISFSLFKFSKYIESLIYSNMTLEEVDKFYNEN